jgi:uncharacterized protein YecE (DUF72 family)
VSLFTETDTRFEQQWQKRRDAGIKCGVAAWQEPTLVKSGLFYPPDVTSAEARLQYYAARYPVVEADTGYYGMLSRHTTELWVQRTPPEFRFDIKAFALFTHHPTKAKSLPKPIREKVPSELQEKNLYLEKLSPDVVDDAWEAFRDALEPLKEAGKLGAVFMQFPAWFVPSRHSLTYLEQVREQLFGYNVAIEFRKHEWMDESHAEGTLAFLRAHDLTYVAVDVPQGFHTSVPPIAEATSDKLAVVRFHGRNHETWNQKGVPPSVRFRYLYSMPELQEWVPKVKQLAQAAREVHVIMNNCFTDYGVRNAREIAELLEEAEGEGG